MRRFLETYAGAAPLIFPKRLELAPGGTRGLAMSPFDDVFERNSRLAWAHAAFETGGGGTVRAWRDWLEACVDSRTAWIPSVETSLTAQLPEPPDGLDRPVPPTTSHAQCSGADRIAGHEQRLLVGPRMTGDHRLVPLLDARSVSAAFLLDPEQARYDAQLFGGRVVFIGATHLAVGDFWLTPGGVLPGVELLANTVRYAPLQRESPRAGVRVAHRALTLLLFVFFVYVEWRLRGLAALFVATLGTLVVVAIGLAAFEDLGVLDALEAAHPLFVACKALETVLGFYRGLEARAVRAGPARMVADHEGRLPARSRYAPFVKETLNMNRIAAIASIVVAGFVSVPPVCAERLKGWRGRPKIAAAAGPIDIRDACRAARRCRCRSARSWWPAIGSCCLPVRR